uniref:Uncharacterized protein n=1 Tax=Hucho hucho TaxID=62062 RepID=A0A4W5N6K9_9TELE
MKPLFRERLAECMGIYIMVVRTPLLHGQTITSRNVKGEYLSTNFAFATNFNMYITRRVGPLNPVVSFSMCVLGRHHWRKFPFYTVFQLIGSFKRALPSLTLSLSLSLSPITLSHAIMNYCQGNLTVTGPTATAQIFAIYPADYLSIWNGTVTLLVCLLALWDKRNSAAPAHLEPLMAGLAVFVIGLSTGGKRPGPQGLYLPGWLAGEESAGRGWFWVPLVAPFLGDMVGEALYQLFIELHHPPLQLESDGLCLENMMVPGLEAMELGLKSFPKDIRSQSLAVIHMSCISTAHPQCLPVSSTSVALQTRAGVSSTPK